MKVGKHFTMKSNNEYVKRLIFEWNMTCPVDRWWRKKHNVAFGSPQHRASSFINQYFEYLEDKMFSELYKEPEKEWIKTKQLTQAEIDKEFDDIDLSKFNDIT